MTENKKIGYNSVYQIKEDSNMMLDTFKYAEGEEVVCVSTSEENHEGLEIGEIYRIVGKSVHDGNKVYAVRNGNGDLIFTVDRFERVALNHNIPKIPKLAQEELVMNQEKENQEKENQEKEIDMVNHPPHYTSGGIETIDYIRAKLNDEAYKGYLQGNALKYLSRTGKKFDAVEDLKKAVWYLNKLIESYEEPTPTLKVVKVGALDDIAPMTKKQQGYIAGLTQALDLDRTNLPKWLSPVRDYHYLTEVEASDVIDKLIAIQEFMQY